MKKLLFVLLLLLFVTLSAKAWAEVPKPAVDPEPGSAPAEHLLQPGDLSRLEFRATALLFYGTAFGVAGVEAGWVSPDGYTAELQVFYLLAHSGPGQQATLRVGRRFDSPNTDLVRHENRLYAGLTPLVGVRYGVFPKMGGTDGYDYKSTDLGLQAGLAFDWGYGSMAGFASRIEFLVTYNIFSDPDPEGPWTYAGSMNPTVTFDLGVLFGGYTSLE